MVVSSDLVLDSLWVSVPDFERILKKGIREVVIGVGGEPDSEFFVYGMLGCAIKYFFKCRDNDWSKVAVLEQNPVTIKKAFFDC